MTKFAPLTKSSAKNMPSGSNKAAKPNPALKRLSKIVGGWQTIGMHPYFPNKTLHGRTTFAWAEGGAFLSMHSRMEDPGLPDGVAVFGSDDASRKYYMLYFDERGVSRKYEVKLLKDGLMWSRDDPKFRQRFTITIADDGRTMEGKGRMSKDGGRWEDDLSLSFSRIVGSGATRK